MGSILESFSILSLTRVAPKQREQCIVFKTNYHAYWFNLIEGIATSPRAVGFRLKQTYQYASKSLQSAL